MKRITNDDIINSLPKKDQNKIRKMINEEIEKIAKSKDQVIMFVSDYEEYFLNYARANKLNLRALMQN